MEVKLKRNSINCYNNVYSTSFSREETAESVVPDVLPDICQIIDTDAVIMLRSKEVEQGRVCLTGIIEISVLYLPDGEGGVRKLGFTMPYSGTVESPSISENTKSVAALKLNTIDTRILNPRKVLVRCDVFAEMDCYDENELSMFSGVEGDGQEIKVKAETCAFSPITAVREKTFVISDEFQIPSSKPPVGEILKKQVCLTVDDAKPVGNKLIFRGVAQVSILYSGGQDNAVVSSTFSTSFSQILETDRFGDDVHANVSLMLTGAYFELVPNSQEGRLISAEIHLVAQVVCTSDTELNYISDAYSNKCALTLSSEDMVLTTIMRQSSLRETIKDVLETPDAVRELIYVYNTMGAVSVNGGNVKFSVYVQAIYRSESGAICRASKRISVESSVEIDEDMEVKVSCVKCAEVYAAVTSGGLEIKMPVDIDLFIVKSAPIISVVSIAADSDQPIDVSTKPSVTVINPDRSSDLWSLAKKYGSTPAMIASANDIEDTEGIVGRLLIIPRER